MKVIDYLNAQLELVMVEPREKQNETENICFNQLLIYISLKNWSMLPLHLIKLISFIQVKYNQCIGEVWNGPV